MFFNNVSFQGGVSLLPPKPGFTISPNVSGKSFWSLVDDGPLTLSTAGTWTIVPNTDFNYNIKMWGAGAGTTASSGAGGAAVGTLMFGYNLTYLLVVGSVTGGGSGSGTGAPGAGYTGIFINSQTQSNAQIIAGGGGGSSTTAAGAGGGSLGQTGEDFSVSPNTFVSGGPLSGGNGSSNGGGGGSGYFGGGGGHGGRGGSGGSQTQGGLTTPSLGLPGGGGGGSGYLHPSVINGTLYTGNRGTAGNAADGDRGLSGNQNTAGKIYIYL